MGGNNGQKGFIEEDEKYLNEGNTISFGQDTATMFYQEVPYFTGDKIKILKCKNDKFNKNNAQFFLSAMRKAFLSFSWGSSQFNVENIESQVFQLPTKSGEIDFDFMESFVAELEAERVAELSAYLKASGLDNYELSRKEEEALEEYKNNNIVFAHFTYNSIFNKIVQGRRLKKDDQIPGNIPFVMSGTTNNGIVNFVSNPVASFPQNSITLDIFGNAFYRNYAFGAGDDTGVYWNSKTNYSKNSMLFLTTAMEKSIKGKYSYGKKLRSSQSYDFVMQLPSKNDKPDFEIMENLISAVQKLVIKDVVLYSERKIDATKYVLKNNLHD